MRCAALILFVMGVWTVARLGASDAPDGTTFEHPVLGVDGPGAIRIKFCGMPVKIQLAELQFKGEASEKAAEAFLKDQLEPGTKITLVMEAEKAGDGRTLPQAHVFKAGTHLNLEMVKRGLAINDGGSKRFASALQNAQMDAMTKKAGLWARGPEAVAQTRPSELPKPATPVTHAAPEMELAPTDYNGRVVADLQGKEYHLPGSRYAKSIRQDARIEYASPEAAEKAGKSPSPFSFPDRAKAAQTKLAAAKGGMSNADTVKGAQAALKEALGYMQEARQASGSDLKRANTFWQKAAKLLGEGIDRLTPVADANPNNSEIQKLAEEMSMNLYSCNKYQSL
ncbi:MAG: thermonuclease family protein [Planctomycetes bacterium]|nr:thermonuclease family protein [Planctomycetota bacterium]